MNQKDSLHFLTKCKEKIQSASDEDIEYFTDTYMKVCKSNNTRKLKLKQIITTILAIILILLIIVLTPVIVHRTTATTEATQEKVIRWYIENKKAPYKEYDTYEEYLADQNQSE